MIGEDYRNYEKQKARLERADKTLGYLIIFLLVSVVFGLVWRAFHG
jgi:hypothetical protein